MVVRHNEDDIGTAVASLRATPRQSRHAGGSHPLQDSPAADPAPARIALVLLTHTNVFSRKSAAALPARARKETATLFTKGFFGGKLAGVLTAYCRPRPRGANIKSRPRRASLTNIAGE